MPDIVTLDCTQTEPLQLSVRYNNGGFFDTDTLAYFLSTTPGGAYESPCLLKALHTSSESTTTSMFRDVNGDGLPDFVSVPIASSIHNTLLARTQNYVAPRRLLTASSLNGNHTMTVNYQAYDGYAPYPIHAPNQISRTRTPLYSGEPTRRTTVTTTYRYDYPTYDRTQHTFTGFPQVVKTDDSFGAYSIDKYSTTYPTVGTLLFRSVQNQDGARGVPINKTYTYTNIPLSGGRTWARLDKLDDQPGGVRDIVTTYSSYDAYGKLLAWTEQGDPATTTDDISHNRTYVARSDTSFLLNLMCGESGSSTAGGALSRTRYYWDSPTALCSVPTKGDLRKVERETTSNTFVNHQYTYDTYGMIATETDEGGAVSTYTYDSTYHYFNIQATNPVGTVYTSYHALSGIVADRCGPQHYGTSWSCSRNEIDLLGRTINSYVPSLPPSISTYSLQLRTSVTYNDQSYPLSMTETTAGGHRVQYRDGFGHPTELRVEETSNNYRVYEIAYDGLGAPLRVELVHREAGASYTHNPPSAEAWAYLHDYVHDAQEQLTYPRNPGDTSAAAVDTRIVYGDRVVMVDPDGNETDYYQDYLGRVSSTSRLGGASGTASTVFTYNTHGDITAVKDPNNLVTSYARNLLGWVTTLTTPDNQLWHYYYTARGQVDHYTDPRGVTVTNSYDSAGRLYHVLSSGEPSSVRHVDGTYTYYSESSDSRYLGWLFYETSDGIQTSYVYNAEGKRTETSVSNGTAAATVDVAFDVAGRLSYVQYPDYQTATFHYNLDDSVEHVGWGFFGGESVSAATFLYEDDGQPSVITNGYGFEENNTYDARGRLTAVASANTFSSYGDLVDDRITLTKGSSLAELDRYGLAPGLVARPTPDRIVPTLDGLGRLTHVTKNGAQLGDYSYDLGGRLTGLNETSTANTSSTTFSADKTISRTLGEQSRTWTYDANGNVTHDDSRVFGTVTSYRDHLWDALGRYVQTSGTGVSGTTTYYYTPSGSISRVVGAGEAASTQDVLQAAAWARIDVGTGASIDTLIVNGRTIGERNNGRFEMPHRTYDGSVLAVSNDLGQIIRQEEFFPYGSRSAGSAAGQFEAHYQGLRRDKLSIAGTRAYDSNGGIWLTRDPFVTSHPASLLQDSRLAAAYAFDFSNPYRWRDPSGLEPEGADGEGPADVDEDERIENETANNNELPAAVQNTNVNPSVDKIPDDYIEADPARPRTNDEPKSNGGWEWLDPNTRLERIARLEAAWSRLKSLGSFKLPTLEARPTLPIFVPGDKTVGVLRTDVGDIPLKSGWAGPAGSIPKGTSGFDIVTRTHVEGHAAAAMREGGIQAATLFINNPNICSSCATNLSRMLPAGGTLTVVTPTNSTTFMGAPK